MVPHWCWVVPNRASTNQRLHQRQCNFTPLYRWNKHQGSIGITGPFLEDVNVCKPETFCGLCYAADAPLPILLWIFKATYIIRYQKGKKTSTRPHKKTILYLIPWQDSLVCIDTTVAKTLSIIGFPKTSSLRSSVICQGHAVWTKNLTEQGIMASLERKSTMEYQ